ncbi:MAG TPA: hypothetical protein VFX60_15060 [Micromonospora sp.]|nr:hypothetical protein [Micromonospora sp.]
MTRSERTGHGRSAAPWVAAGLGIAGTAYRVWAIANHYPRFDSDEAAMGLGALHIARGENFPIFLYGQNYMGSIESYLAAPFLSVLGITVTALRIPEIMIFSAFAALMYLLAVRLHGSRWFAATVVGLLALGSDRVMKDELIAHGGSAEIKLFAAALFLIALAAPAIAPRRRVFAYTGFGFIAGLALWSHWLIIPYLLAAGLLLLWGARGMTSRHGAALLAGVLVGAGPLIGYNLGAAPGEDSLSVFLQLNGGEPTPLSRRAVGAVILGVPLATGACGPGNCDLLQRSWALVYLGLMVTSGVTAVRLLRRRPVGDDRLRAAAMALLLVAAGGSIAAYARSPAAGQTPIESARYLSCLLVSTPALLWPVWVGLGAARRARIPAAIVVAITAMVMTNATLAVIRHAVPEARQVADDERALISALEAQGVKSIYSEYWTCNRVSYLSQERTVCVVLDEELRPGLDRWLPYRRRVAADPAPAFVFPQGSAADQAFIAHLARLGIPSDHRAVGGYHLYRTATVVPLPR